MRSTTSKFKEIMASGNARSYVFRIVMTLADNTELTLTHDDVWEGSFTLDTASSGTSSLDIGSAIIGKCSFTINNINGDFDSYDFFNASATVWVGLEGDVDTTTTPATQVYYRMGFYTVDEPQKANGLISLELLDNMWKFDRPFSGVNINYPATARTIVQNLCSYCGVQLANSNFHGYNFSISEAPKDVEHMNCREMLQYVVMLGCNFCVINDTGQLQIKWYDTSATTATTDVFERNMSTSFGTDDIEITGVKFVIDKTEHTIGGSGYVLELDNPLVTESNVNAALNSIWDVLEGFTLRTFNLTTASDLAAEIGDKCKIKDYKGNYVYSWITLNTFKTAGHLIQCNAEPPNRTLVTRYSQTVQASVEEARKAAQEQISNYDLSVQELNKLSEQAMGAYTEYEDRPTGGRYYYLSNMPITKDPVTGVCSFSTNSIVYRMAGDVFTVSTDGGITWQNGYNPSTGQLIVNVLDAIGINFDWARGGTLTLGGYGNGNGVMSILNSSNVEKVRGDNTGIKVGSNVGSRLHINTNGGIKFDYDNAYGGVVQMDAVNHGTPTDPDIRDTFLIEDFNDIGIRTNETMAEIYLSTKQDSQSSYDTGYIALFAHKQTGESQYQYSELRLDGNGFYIDSAVFVGERQGYNGEQGQPSFIGSDFKQHYFNFANGICVGYEAQGLEVPHVEWHKWSSPEPYSYYVAITLEAGNTYATFPECDNSDDEVAYEPFIKSANGTSPPQITDISQSGSNITVTFTAVTSEQAAGGACAIRLLKIRG